MQILCKECASLSHGDIDYRGLKSAFHAFLNSKKNLRPSDLLALPGLNMTHRQLFFISFAQVSDGAFNCVACEGNFVNI
jgi:hypothetical protein